METGAQKSKDLNPMTWEFFVQEFIARYVTDMYRESKWKQFLNMK